MTAIAVLGNFESSWVNIHVRSHGRKSIRSWGGWIDGEVSPPILTPTSILNCPFLKLILLEQTPLLTCFLTRQKWLVSRRINLRKASSLIDVGVEILCGGFRGRKLGFAKTSFLAEKCTHQFRNWRPRSWDRLAKTMHPNCEKGTKSGFREASICNARLQPTVFR